MTLCGAKAPQNKSLDQRMQGIVRIGISAALGLIVSLAALLVFYGESTFGQAGFIASLLIITTVVSYSAAFGTNVGVSAISCSGVKVAKVGYSSAIVAASAAVIVALFLLIESWSGAFGFIFNTVNFPAKLSDNWPTASIVGLLFALFWATLYGQLVAGSMVEMC
jgi:hypothetical protein